MGYLLIFLFVLSNVSRSVCSKKISARVQGISENLNISIARSLISLPVCLLLLASGASLALPLSALAVTAFAGVCLALNYAVWLAALDRGAYVLVSAANNAGFLVVTAAGLLFFGEKMTLGRTLSILLILGAMYFMLRYQIKGLKKVPTCTDLVLLFFVFFTQGLFLCAQKWFLLLAKESSSGVYTFYTFLFSLLFLLLIRPFFRSDSSVHTQCRRVVSLAPYVLLIGVALFLSTFFQSRAAALLDAVVLYPLSSALNLVGGGLMAWLVFREKPTRDACVGMLLVFFALICSRY